MREYFFLLVLVFWLLFLILTVVTEVIIGR